VVSRVTGYDRTGGRLPPATGAIVNEDILAAYAWAETDRTNAFDALSITLARPAGTTHLDRLKPRSRFPTAMTVDEALSASLAVEDYAWGSLIVQTDTLGDWSVLLEPNGWAASTPEIVALLSAEGEAVNVFWNVNADMSVCVARGGTVVRQFDPLLYDDRGSVAEEAGLPFGDPGRVMAASLAFLTRVTGVSIERAWLFEQRRPSYLVSIPITPA
jgi:hypothetical protein